MNLWESLVRNVQRPAAPPHVGEAFAVWNYYLAVSETRVIFLVLVNHTNDTDLKETLEHFIADVIESQITDLRRIMKNEGITVPAIGPDVPKADDRAIPPGARFDSDVIGKLIQVMLDGLLERAFQGLRSSYRSDHAAQFMKYMSQIVAQGYTARETGLERGWLPVPPSYNASVPGPQ